MRNCTQFEEQNTSIKPDEDCINMLNDLNNRSGKAILMSRQRFLIISWIDDEFIRSFKLSDEAETRNKNWVTMDFPK